jgi:hypothetical protein
MSLFEFVLVMVSLVIAIGVTHLLRHASQLVRLRGRVELGWMPLLWMATLFLYAVSYWWALWDWRVLEWTFPGFFFLLLAPTLLYVGISLLAAPEAATVGGSTITAFETIRRPFFVILAVFQLLVSFDGWIMGSEPLWNQLRWLQAALFGFCVLGAANSRPAAQGLVAVGVFLLLIFGNFVFRYLPGAFGSG